MRGQQRQLKLLGELALLFEYTHMREGRKAKLVELIKDVFG